MSPVHESGRIVTGTALSSGRRPDAIPGSRPHRLQTHVSIEPLCSATMGESSPAHFTWLSSAILEHRHVFGRLRQPPTVFAIAEQGETAPLSELANVRGGRTTVRLFDLTPTSAAVERLDLNRLGGLPSGAFDVITLFRASFFIRDPAHVLAGFHRILRPGGILVVDWLHRHI